MEIHFLFLGPIANLESRCKTFFLKFLFFLPVFAFAQSNPVASFTANKTSGCNPLTVEFINTSQNSATFKWNFGNGDTSALVNPSTLYLYAGSYSVSLIALSSSGQSDTLVLQNLVEVTERPVSSFSVSNNHSCANGDPVVFSNNSSYSTNWIWDFGDGVNSALTNPSHVYTNPGVFSVALIAQNSIGCSNVKLLTQYVIISTKPSADFSADTTKFCSLNHPFIFTPVTTNASNYYWNFYDGIISAQPAPSHIFSSPGKYNVSLSLTDQNGCSNSMTKYNFITVSEELNPVFSSTSSNGCTPLTVSFNSNLSSSLGFQWNFGDGNSSTATNPSHLYNDPGIFTVSLNVVDANNCSFSFSSDSLVNTNDPLHAEFTASSSTGCAPLNVTFTDNSVNATYWSWDFGDGTVSSIKNPSHIYTDPGIYNITLTVHNQSNCESTIQKSGLINVTGPETFFSVSGLLGCTPLTVSFSDSSTGAVQWFWDFGDGTTSTVKDPVHTYNTEGFFSVKHVSFSNNGCSDTLVKNGLVHAFDPNISFNEIDTINSCNETFVSFNGSSLGTQFWWWDFGDSTFSSIANPTHSFSTPGLYTVSLTTQTSNGCTITINNYNVIRISGADLDFSYSLDSCPNFIASFSNSLPEAVSWFWNFGDGTFSTAQNPSHTYPNSGFFSVGLTVNTSSGCTYSIMKNNIVFFSTCGQDSSGGGGGIGGGEFPDGYGNGDSTNNTLQITGCSPFKVFFANPFDSATSFQWSFGDGNSSTLENPSHIYSTEGIYTVILVAGYPDNSYDTLVRNQFIKVNKAEANFSVQQNNNCENSIINLTNTSINATSQIWNFGDGDSSVIQNPVHTFLESGNYLLKLKSYDDYGCNNLSVKNIFAGVIIPVFNINENACINDSILFSSNMNFFNSYQWNFGDGDSSADENPVHVYDSTGNFMVSLTVFDSTGCSFTHIFPGEIHIFNPIADFSFPVNPGCNTLLASFNNLSADADHWSWDFGDGAVSFLQNPTHIYTTPGTYGVSLTVEKNGCFSQETIPNAITVFESVAGFSFSQNTLCLPITAMFTDSSKDAVSWMWDFGDGTMDSVQNPVHVFETTPQGNISLTIIDMNGCSASASMENIDEFVVSATASATQGCETLNVNFTDMTNGAVSWEWDFGDGSVSSLQHPSHFYSDSGSYSVMFIAESPDGCRDTVAYSNFINVYKVIADFNSPSLLSGCNPLLVNFLDNSLNATLWAWNFGDGATSTQKNPWHIYSLPSLDNVTLIASNNFGCKDTLIKDNFVNVSGPVASFGLSAAEGCRPMQVQFFDSSFNNAIGLTWYFGDGDTSHAANPVHLFDSSGSFTVSLLAEDTSGCSSFYTFPQDILINPAPQATFNNFTDSGCQPLSILFDPKLEATDSAYWNFGDGSFSHSTAGGHTYDSAGVFQAFLVASNSFGCSDTFYYPLVTVFPVPKADFTAVITKGCSPLTVNFTSTSQNLNNPVFQWNSGIGEQAGGPNFSVIYQNGGLYDVSLIVVNEHNCSDSIVKNDFIVAFDNLPPEVSGIVLVTVPSNSSITIEWEKSKAVDFEKYVLFRKDFQGTQYNQVAVIDNINIISFTDENLNTLNKVYGYKLQTFDFCGNSKTLAELIEHRAINVTAIPDSSKIKVSWTPYTGCSIGKYEILRAKPGQEDFYIIADVDASILSFEDTSWYCFAEYSYKVKALDVCGNPLHSFSDTSVAKADENILAKQTVEIVRSTVIENSMVFTEWKAPEFAPEKVAGYKIFRSIGNMKFDLVGVLPSTIQSFTDGNVDVSKQNYFYKVETVNVCNVKSLLSNNSSSILLEAEKDGFETNLKWTPYKNWENGVEQYIIEKQDEYGNWQIIKIVDGNSTEWKDILIK